MGDFNLDCLDDSNKNFMMQLLPSYNQLVHSVTTDYGSALDHVYTTLPLNTVQCTITESYFTDHKPLICSLMI
jgi:hypothetical protein